MTHGFTSDAYPAGAHICYLYHDDEERRRVDSAFVTRGLAAGQTVAYLADPSKERLGDILPKLGLPLSKAQRNRLVVESAPSICFRHNRFVPAKLLARLRDQYEIGRSRGNNGARLIGEMSWAARGVRARTS
jgi:MEDS: MEthanogen/methylotroph, DcmR Sensory domain